jgi:hypothetical protein
VSHPDPTIDHHAAQLAAILLTIGAIFLAWLTAAQSFPEVERLMLPTVLVSTNAVEVLGPMATRFAIRRPEEEVVAV